ncbi:MAG: BamA/TamA family outer membrane protein [Fibrobacterota bacterium]
MNHRLLPCILLLTTLVWSAKPSVEIATPGKLGHSRLVELLAVPANLAKQPIDSQEIWADFADSSVVLAARSEGFLDARCAISLTEIDTASGRAKVVVDFAEGPMYRYGKIVFVGPDGSADPPVPPGLSVASSDNYRPSRTNELLQESQQYYLKRGWLDASVEPDLTMRPDSALVDVRLTVNLGRVAVFEGIEIRFKGRHITDPEILKGLWDVEPGDTIRNENIAKYNRKIGQTRLFNMAKLTRVPGRIDADRTFVIVDLAERAPGSIDLGLSWEPKFGWGVDGTIRHKNIKGSLYEWSLEAIMAENRQKARAGAGNPLFLGSPISLDYGFSVLQQEADLADPAVYREFSLANDFTFSYLPTEWSNISLGLGTQRLTKYPILGESYVLYQFKTDLGGSLDFRNDPFDPTSGWTLRGDLGWGGQFGTATSFVWVQSMGRVYQPLFWRFLSAFALEGGEFLNTTTVDGSKIFYLGGSRSVRSYTFQGIRATPDSGQELCPRYLRASGELRVNLPLNLQGVGFLDWARVWNNGQEPDFTDMEKARIGYGTGLRYRLSLFSLRFDYAFGRGPERWSFDLAQAI